VAVYDLSGRRVRLAAEEWRDAGEGEVVWDLTDTSGRPVAAGLYLMRAQLGGATWTRRVTVVK
jgi:hypothetical protein